MPTIPTDNRAMLIFCQAHEATWAGQTTAIGVTAAQNTALSAAIEDAAKALDEANIARVASKGATTTFNNDSRSLRDVASDMVRSIQTFAKNTDNPGVYGLADIPAPQPRSANALPPGQPSDIRAGVNPDGSLTLTWKSNNPRGVSSVVYKVQRALNGSSTYALIDTVGERTYNDMTVPIGASSVSYIITGKRGAQTGPMSEAFTARFGSVEGGGGVFIASTVTTPSAGVKMAA
jgi:hypothetical protein